MSLLAGSQEADLYVPTPSKLGIRAFLQTHRLPQVGSCRFCGESHNEMADPSLKNPQWKPLGDRNPSHYGVPFPHVSRQPKISRNKSHPRIGSL